MFHPATLEIFQDLMVNAPKSWVDLEIEARSANNFNFCNSEAAARQIQMNYAEAPDQAYLDQTGLLIGNVFRQAATRIVTFGARASILEARAEPKTTPIQDPDLDWIPPIIAESYVRGALIRNFVHHATMVCEARDNLRRADLDDTQREQFNEMNDYAVGKLRTAFADWRMAWRTIEVAPPTGASVLTIMTELIPKLPEDLAAEVKVAMPRPLR